MENRLYRSRSDVMLGGVCSGLGKYLALDPTIVRIFFIVLSLSSGFGFLIYLILWIVLPVEGALQPAGVPTSADDLRGRAEGMRADVVGAFNRPNPQGARWFGIALIIFGGIVLIDNMHLPFMTWFNHEMLWPALLVLGGIALLLRAVRKE